MKGMQLKLIFDESAKHQLIPLHEWLLKEAHSMEIEGASAIKGIAGFGRSGQLHEKSLFELGAKLPVEVTLLTTEEKAQKFLTRLKEEKLPLVYSIHACEWDVI
ncbi:MAG: DUF190 domain-containing protein [Simkaniaceae bacterium]|nr:DUF190 domain-containing protein [Simkaniaceae bacterium]